MRIAVQNATKRFGAMAAANDVTLAVEEGELFTLLGPSGCGKTTLLRLIAGFYSPDEGEIRFDGQRVNEVPPHERGIGMVFQNYALWPHMTVFDNVAYGLKLRKVGGGEIEKRVHAVLEKVKLGGLDKRYPGQLSGGQQQRVALARALVLNPEILLLDEPLSNLDAKIRIQVRAEIRKLQKELGITTIYVTHDQEEALTLSDRIAVFDKGKLLEVGPPKTLYEHPRTRFVADFIGINNLIEGTVTAVDAERGRLRAQTALGEWSALFTEARPAGSRCALCIRPENIDLDGGAGEELNVVPGQITFAAYLGNTLRYDVDLGGGVTFKADIRDPWHHAPLAIGAQVRLAFPAGDTVAIAAEA
ncbi:ABC transporter ATP-binding protein [Betaproteobacteria bacterium PRO7]|jgi:spermidine/putrescine ABC transporter ATP-binding subunit|nr:ABC transporter ATP-binding protein [Betaproteobacteria bacterium PRO7]